MQLRIRQRIFSWTDSYDVYDEDGYAKYEVRGALFSLGHQIHVYRKNADEANAEAGYIRQKLFALMPTFEIVKDGYVCGTIRKKFTLFSENYEVDYRGWQVEGDFLGWDYRVRENGKIVATIAKELFNWSDTYVLNYYNPADEAAALLLVLAIDAANCTHNQ